jgi:hypothetical protein
MTMLKSIVMHDIKMSHIAAMERWYFKDHSPEIVRRFGPWETRHESYLPVDAPPDARAYGFYNWRVTEGWWRELPKPGPQGNLSFTPPPVSPKVATCFVPTQPTEDFLGWEIRPHDRQVLRWFIMFRYPPGVPLDEGEEWFLGTHVPEVMRQPGLYRFFSHRTVHVESGLPGTWAPSDRPPPGHVRHDWVRCCELWYENFDDWRRSVIEAPPAYTKPAWASRPDYPFLAPLEDFACSFLLERPTDEYLRDARSYL